MSLPASALRRPVTTVAATAALVLLGAVVEGQLTLTHDAPIRLVRADTERLEAAGRP